MMPNLDGSSSCTEEGGKKNKLQVGIDYRMVPPSPNSPPIVIVAIHP